MAVTVDKYELPIAVEDKTIDLAKRLNMNHSTVRTQIRQKSQKPTLGIRCLKIELDECDQF